MLLAESLGVRVVAEPTSGIRCRLVDAFLICSVKGHARAARIDEPLDIVLQTAIDDILRAERIDAVKVLPRAPDASDSCGMKDDINAFASVRRCCRITQVARHRLDAKLVELRVAAARERPHSVAARDQLLGDVLSKEATSSRHQGEQDKTSEAERLSVALAASLRTTSVIAEFGIILHKPL